MFKVTLGVVAGFGIGYLFGIRRGLLDTDLRRRVAERWQASPLMTEESDWTWKVTDVGAEK